MTKKEYEDFLLQLDSTFADIESAKRKGYLSRDLKKLREIVNNIYKRRSRKRNPPPAS